MCLFVCLFFSVFFCSYICLFLLLLAVLASEITFLLLFPSLFVSLLSVCKYRRRAIQDDVELDMVTDSDTQLVAGQRRQRRTANTALYTVDDLPRVTHLNDAEVLAFHLRQHNAI